ncbi:hypothetical protein [Hephaestia mangrovi]|uniref:hypothetical protein n=1 Tax=Hephaestia mangrovi TaxID=2873268 RepID=UPI001CA65AF7|nr:hypothetical protein [Hephaestia mangrovi]MBY8829372.1 hypothetical protein [Hephaestia mangrovi]
MSAAMAEAPLRFQPQMRGLRICPAKPRRRQLHLAGTYSATGSFETLVAKSKSKKGLLCV